jgi:hypothetical protein
MGGRDFDRDGHRLTAPGGWSRARAAAAAALALLSVGCASQQSQVESKEQMLVAAGFLEKPATSPERQQQLATLKPFTLLRQPIQVNGQDTFGYLYADPKYCHCVLTGNAGAYQAFRQLAQQQKIAQEQLEAAELAQEDAFDWGTWGPYGY